MLNDLRSDISDAHLPSSEIVRLAERITAVCSSYEYLTDQTLPMEHVEYLLNFQCPLEMLVDNWPTKLGGIMDMSYLVDDIFDRQDALQGGYPLMSEAPVAASELTQDQPTYGKPSLLAGLREAQARTASENHPKDTPTPKHTEPEL